ncbi:MAG: Gfo/Idh/MocA family oxidoreductase [Alphaproteobacteria bacterium]|nr:Gfo/Idh/MocA family oxidoreductase [Alphaproteobacteria bacterium]
MSRIRCAVVGAGHFGRFHADKYSRIPDAELVAVVDRDAERAAAIAGPLGARAETSLDAVIGQIDAASVAVPTQGHFDVARRLLEAGVHVLIEKPITETLEQADALIALAKSRGLVLQVGHLQRFLLERLDAKRHIDKPLYIEAVRIAPFKPRGTDVGVVLDLMIHDIDLILAIVNSPITMIDAVGAPVVTSEEDIVNTRLRFANGCVATVTASRISFKTERRLRIFQRQSYVSIDLQARKLVAMRKGHGQPWFPGLPPIDREEISFEDGDDLLAEIASFVECVRTGRTPVVTGEDGRRALATAMAIGASLQESLRAAGVTLDA